MSSLHRHSWTRAENEAALHCYYQTNPAVRGYRARMFERWCELYPDTIVGMVVVNQGRIQTYGKGG